MRYYAAFFALLLIAFSSTVSLACEEPPLPLRGMYVESDLIVVGKIGKPGRWIAGKREADSDYQIFNRSFPVTVEKVLKGDAHGKLSISEENYHYLGEGDNGVKPAAAPAADVESELAKDSGRRLFFLDKDEEGNYREIYSNRYNFAPKGKDLDVYISRIGELAEMYKNGEPKKEAIVEWLVAMAENSVTRFEGAYELRESFYDLKWKTEQEAEAAAKEAAKDHAHSVKEEMEKNDAPLAVDPNPENSEVSEEGEDHEEYRSYGEADFAKLLTQGQRDRLLKAFFSVKWNYEPKKVEDSESEDSSYVEVLSEGDRELVDAVALTGDRRAVARILQELPNLAKHENYMAANYLEIISGNLKNEKLKKLVEKYSEVAYGGVDEKIEQKTSAYDMEDFEGTDEQKAALLAMQPDKTYGQRRGELLDKIYASMNQLMAKK